MAGRQVSRNIRLLKLSSSVALQTIQSLSLNCNLLFDINENHSFSVFAAHQRLNDELFRIALPSNWPRIANGTNFQQYASHMINNSSDVLCNYMIFMLGKGKSCLAFFDSDHNLLDCNCISKTIEINGRSMLRFSKREPILINDRHLQIFHNYIINKYGKWSLSSNMRRLPFTDGTNMKTDPNLNIFWIAADKQWQHFWEADELLFEKFGLQYFADKSGKSYQSLMPFIKSDERLVRVSQFGIEYPRKSDVHRFKHETKDFLCVINNQFVDDAFFPVEIRDLMLDQNICWDPELNDEQKEEETEKEMEKAVVGEIQTHAENSPLSRNRNIEKLPSFGEQEKERNDNNSDKYSRVNKSETDAKFNRLKNTKDRKNRRIQKTNISYDIEQQKMEYLDRIINKKIGSYPTGNTAKI